MDHLMFYGHRSIFLIVRDYDFMEKIKNTVKKFTASCPLPPKRGLASPLLPDGPPPSLAAGQRRRRWQQTSGTHAAPIRDT